MPRNAEGVIPGNSKRDAASVGRRGEQSTTDSEPTTTEGVPHAPTPPCLDFFVRPPAEGWAGSTRRWEMERAVGSLRPCSKVPIFSYLGDPISKKEPTQSPAPSPLLRAYRAVRPVERRTSSPQIGGVVDREKRLLIWRRWRR